ncbi:MAG TPA: carbohydrate ABC transporter permease [Limnochordia bacterium]|nr:carbohydrate ABC transporter permease [Bacillota bacterium]HOK32840.1 carbohydrate ABC transporter permease [Limnochordia bacterium]
MGVLNGRSRRFVKQALIYLCLTVGAFVMIFPLLWMFSTSFKTPWEIYDVNILPQSFQLSNYEHLLKNTGFLRWLWVSSVVVICTTASVLVFDSLVGYTLAKLQFRGKNIIFMAILATLMVPTEMLIIPWYIMSVDMGLRDTYLGIMFPGMITAFGIFLTKQFYEGVPNDLLDAARIDGLNEVGVYARIALPQVKPALSALIIFNFLGNWNAYLWPLIVAQSPHMRTIPVGISFFSNEVTTAWHLIMTASSCAIVPVLVVFVIFQKHIIKGVQLSGLKG